MNLAPGADAMNTEPMKDGPAGHGTVSVIAVPGIPEITEGADLADRVRRAVNRLPDEQRIVVELAYYGGRTHRENAPELGIPEGTAKSRMRLAHDKLKPLLERELVQAHR